MKKIFSLLLVANVLNTNAQFKNIPILIKGDFGSSNVKTNSGKGSSTFALGVGAETFFKLKGIKNDAQLVVNPNLSYIGTGYKTIVGGEIKVNYLLIGLPICYEVFGLKSSNDMGLIIGAGPYVNVALNGKFKNLASDNFKKMSFGNSNADNRKSADVGLIIKSAVRVKKLYMGLQYNVGLSNVIPKDRISNGNFIKTRNLLFYASYSILN